MMATFLQISQFKKMLKEAGKTDVSELKVKPSQLESLVERYKAALKQIPDILKVLWRRDTCQRLECHNE